jgi:hypothetical protein
MNPKLMGVCCAVRFMVRNSNSNILKSIYYAYFHSIVKYGIIFWGNSSNSGKIFTLQKEIIRIIAGAHPRISFTSLFKEPGFLSVPF